uniref:Uncharacterized protein n=1 Tax=Lepeophtheirus salmonis TaxID=72036 RepID=A0A0K2SZ11_LEPSM
MDLIIIRINYLSDCGNCVLSKRASKYNFNYLVHLFPFGHKQTFIHKSYLMADG